nr:hypothetical protein CFP56_52120 [Quercus suber]
MVCHEKQGVEEIDDNMIPIKAVDKRKSSPTDVVMGVGNLNNNSEITPTSQMMCLEEKELEGRLMSDDVVLDVGNLESNWRCHKQIK